MLPTVMKKGNAGNSIVLNSEYEKTLMTSIISISEVV